MSSSPDKDIPVSVLKLIVDGANRRNLKPDSEIHLLYEKRRAMARKWRHLVGEAKFDIPDDLWPFICWDEPSDWDAKSFYKISSHTFLIKLPKMLPVGVAYKTVSYNEWYFSRFELCHGGSTITSYKYYDLPLFLAISCELSRPRKHDVKIEEIAGELTSGVKLKRFKEVMTEEETLYHNWNGWYGP